MPIPDYVAQARARISAHFLAGCSRGIEIGALDAPTPVPAGCSVLHVDLRTNAELAVHYPKLDPATFVPVDVVDDGARLATFENASVDFLIANHLLEHCENPLGALRRHLAVVRPGGWLFYALPDRRIGFETGRPVTAFEHLVRDDADGGASSRDAHYLEWATYVNGFEGDAARENARKVARRGYSIHFHVWDSSAWLEALVRAHDYLGGAFEVRFFEFTGTEIVSVLRRSG